MFFGFRTKREVLPLATTRQSDKIVGPQPPAHLRREGIMYLLYVDESGDVGIDGSPGRYFALSGFVVHELRWHDTLEAILDFRRRLRDTYGVKLREELHAGNMLHKPGELARIPKSIRLKILREALDFQSALAGVSIVNIVVDKLGKPLDFDVFDVAWVTLIQRFHNTISYKNFPGPQNPDDRGLLVVDASSSGRLVCSLTLRRLIAYRIAVGAAFAESIFRRFRSGASRALPAGTGAARP